MGAHMVPRGAIRAPVVRTNRPGLFYWQRFIAFVIRTLRLFCRIHKRWGHGCTARKFFQNASATKQHGRVWIAQRHSNPTEINGKQNAQKSKDFADRHALSIHYSNHLVLANDTLIDPVFLCPATEGIVRYFSEMRVLPTFFTPNRRKVQHFRCFIGRKSHWPSKLVHCVN